MKILICGYGFVGKVHALALSNKDHDIQIYDPAYDIYKERLINPDAAVICVSTPQEKDGSCNIINVYECIAGIENDEAPILIKSTISLEGWRFLLREFPNKKISFSPEFLRADHAWEDFKKQEVVYVGGGDNIFWSSLLSVFLGVKVQCADPESLILAKYFRNSFLATKVAFFNQIEDLCNKVGVDGDKVSDIVTADPRIGTSHSYVYQDPARGFGGHCFPKDTLALLKTGEQYDYDLTILREAVTYNKKLRGEE